MLHPMLYVVVVVLMCISPFTLNSWCRAFVVATIDCAFIAECRVVVGRARRQNQRDVAVDEAVVRAVRGRSLSPMSSVIALACHSSRDAVNSCALWASSSSGIVGGKTRIRTACRTARVCPESVAWVSSSTRTSSGSRDIPAAHWSRQTTALAFSAEYYYVVMMSSMTLAILRRSVNLRILHKKETFDGGGKREKKEREKKREKKFRKISSINFRKKLEK